MATTTAGGPAPGKLAPVKLRPEDTRDCDGGDAVRAEPARDLIVVAGLMVGLSLSALDGTIVATALPTIVGDLGGLEQLSWVVTSYLLASTAATPLFGRLSDLYGRRRLFQVAIVIFIVGSLLAACRRPCSS